MSLFTKKENSSYINEEHIKRIKGDGNCAPRAISERLSKEYVVDHESFRNAVVEHLRKINNREDIGINDYYLGEMSKLGKHFDGIEINASMKIVNSLGYKLIIWQCEGDSLYTKRKGLDQNDNYDKEINLIYNGNGFHGHYDLYLPDKSKSCTSLVSRRNDQMSSLELRKKEQELHAFVANNTRNQVLQKEYDRQVSRIDQLEKEVQTLKGGNVSMTITPLNQNNGIVTQPNVIIGDTGLPIGYVSHPMIIGDPFSPMIGQPNVIGNALGVQGVFPYSGCIYYGS